MKRNWAVKGLKFALFAALFFTVLSFAVMRLWNWLMPALFGGHEISFWQAVGVLVLCKILFGGFRGGAGPPPFSRRRLTESWEALSAQERGKVRQGPRGRCGPFRPPPAAP